MSSSSGFPPTTEVHSLLNTVRSHTLKNKTLDLICATNGLKRGGVKADMQNRIVGRINYFVQQGDASGFRSIQASILREAQPTAAASAGQSYTTGYISSSTSRSSPQTYPYSMPNYSNGYGHGLNGHRAQPASSQSGLIFKTSPFYEMDSLVGDVRTCEVMTQHRNSISIPIKLNSYPVLQKCVNDPSMRVMVFCAANNNGQQDIAFPHQCEIKVNGGEVKANLRGLKNKPGSTRPVDITDLLRLKVPNYNNNVEFIYALTQKKFYVALYVCKTHSASSLVRKIERQHRISKNSVIQEICKKAQDQDVLATSQVLSLKCPLSYMRLDLPVRSLSCKHIQCFDATSYLQLQEQGPQWLCPICNKPAVFANLAVDEYVKDILANTSKNVDQITIEENGSWHVKSTEEDEEESDNNNASYLEDDDDLVITSDLSFANRSTATPNRTAPFLGTPNTGASREGSSMPRGSGSAKRPAAQVIDLTLSDDDEPIQPPAKRQHLSGANGFY